VLRPLTVRPAIRQCRVCRYGKAQRQSTETPANSTTLRHFSVSSATSLPNSAGVIGFGMPPISARRATSLGSFSASPTALLSVAMTSGGVPWARRCRRNRPTRIPAQSRRWRECRARRASAVAR